MLGGNVKNVLMSGVLRFQIVQTGLAVLDVAARRETTSNLF